MDFKTLIRLCGAVVSASSKKWVFPKLTLSAVLLYFQRQWRSHNSRSFANFVYNVLRHHSVLPSIRKFSLRYLGVLSQKVDARDAESWLSSAIARNVQDISLEYYDAAVSLRLPAQVLRCTTLVALKLSGKITLTVEEEGLGCFPSLKTLHLGTSVVNVNGNGAAGRFISSCPVLENLLIFRDDHNSGGQDGVKAYSISSPTLKRLQIQNCPAPGMQVNARKGMVEINVPKLEYLDLTDHYSQRFSISNLGSLVEANIDLGEIYRVPVDDLGRGIQVVVFESIGAFSNAKVLSLSSHTSLVVGLKEQFLSSKFPNLTRLSLGNAWSGAWGRLLPLFLHSSDHLQVLEFVKDPQKDGGIRYGWSAPTHVPRCLLSSLRTVSVHNFLGQYELGVIRYILSNGRVLKELQLHYHEQVMRGDKLRINAEIFEVPRISEACQITFYH